MSQNDTRAIGPIFRVRTKRAFGVAFWAAWAILAQTACSQSPTPRGMTEVTDAASVAGNVVGGAKAAQTGAPEPKAAEVPKAGGAQPGDAPSQTLAAEVFAQRCVLCHGPKGVGNGVAAENLMPKPRNLRDPAWQKTATNTDIAAIVLKGGAGVGKSMMMPANPDLADKPEVVAALVEIVRGFGK